jgi:hypothetical protein
VIDRLQDRVGGLSEALAGDGYSLVVTGFADGVVAMRLETLDDACEECLVPQKVMEGILLEALRDVSPSVSAVTVEMP